MLSCMCLPLTSVELTNVTVMLGLTSAVGKSTVWLPETSLSMASPTCAPSTSTVM